MKPSHISLFTGGESCATSTARRPVASSPTATLIRLTRKLQRALPKHRPVAADLTAAVTVELRDIDRVPEVDAALVACRESADPAVPVGVEDNDPALAVDEATVGQSSVSAGLTVVVAAAVVSADAPEVDAASPSHDVVASVSTAWKELVTGNDTGSSTTNARTALEKRLRLMAVALVAEIGDEWSYPRHPSLRSWSTIDVDQRILKNRKTRYYD